MTDEARDEVEELLQRGTVLAREGDMDAAIARFDDAVRLAPSSGKPLLSRGIAWGELGETGLALADFGRAIELEPSLAPARFWRGYARRQAGDTEGAIADFDDAIRLDPEETLTFWHRGAAWRELGEPERALRDLDVVVERMPESGRARAERAEALVELDRTDEALEELEAALRTGEAKRRIHRLRSAIHLERGDFDRAEEDLAALNRVDGEGETMGTHQRRTLVAALLGEHFSPATPEELSVTERVFPIRTRPDVQRAVRSVLVAELDVAHFSGVHQRNAYEGYDLPSLIVPDRDQPTMTAPPQYEEVDVGEDEPVRCLKTGLWLLRSGETPLAVLLAPAAQHGMTTGLKFQVMAKADEEGERLTRGLIEKLSEAIRESRCYRGKILSLECRSRSFGEAVGIAVHRLRPVAREDVILPRTTLDLLDRNVIGFAKRRSQLLKLGLPVRKGILFYGPPGTGKTHTVHYLAGALPGHTTLLITAEQIAALGEYMTLARLLQPSVVVIEDVDLVARDRVSQSIGAQVILHGLLNEMDGLRTDAEILFILTTNRPETLETALASRPGRIDQAIEFPLPDAPARAKLVRLYACGLGVPDDLLESIVKRTENVSAAFIKELMRRCAQSLIERDGGSEVADADVDTALDELLFSGGSLNRKLLGVHAED